MLVLAAGTSPLTTAFIAAGAAIGAAGLNVLATGRRARSERRYARVAVARELQAELIGAQSALGRSLLRQAPLRSGEMLKSSLTYDDLAPLIAWLGAREWQAVARALGWVTYLRDAGPNPDIAAALRKKNTKAAALAAVHKHLADIFQWLDAARYALSAASGYDYEPYRPRHLVSSVLAEGTGATEQELTDRAPRSLTAEEAKTAVHEGTVRLGP